MIEIACSECGNLFSTSQSKRSFCSSACKSRKNYRVNGHKHLATRRNQYASDPEYRKKVISYMADRRAENPERIREINARSRDRPDRRAKAAQTSRNWHAQNKEYANPKRIMRKQTQRTVEPWRVLVNAAKARAKAFNIPFDLTHEWGKARWTGRCELTNIEFIVGLRGSSGKMFSPSLDKIVPSLGYVQSNCRIVLHCVNTFKYTGTDDQIYAVAEALLAHREIIQLYSELDAP